MQLDGLHRENGAFRR